MNIRVLAQRGVRNAALSSGWRAGIGVGAAWLLLALVFDPVVAGVFFAGAGVLLLLFTNWGLFLVVSTLFYSATQFLLVDVSVVSLGAVPVNAAKLFMLVLTGLLCVRLAAAPALGERLPRPSPAVVGFGCFVAWAAGSTSFAREPEAFSVALRLLATLVAFYFGLFTSQGQRLWTPVCIGLCAIVAGLSTPVESLASGGSVFVMGGAHFRAGGSFAGSNTTAAMALTGLPVFAYWLTTRRRRWWWLGWLGIACLALALILTLTRTAFLGAVLFFAAWLWRAAGQRRRRTRELAHIGIVVGLIVVALALVPNIILEARTRDIPGLSSMPYADISAGAGREMIWKTVWAQTWSGTASQIFAGHGLNSCLEDLVQIVRVKIGAHNSYLEVLYDLGLVGLALLLWALGRTLYEMRPPQGLQTDSRAALIAFLRSYFFVYCLTTIMFNGYIYSVGATWFTFLGAGYAVGLSRQAPPLADVTAARAPAAGRSTGRQ